MDQRIKDYIKNSLLTGNSIEQIKQNLLAAGWPAKDVNDAINPPQEKAPPITREIPYSAPSELVVKETKINPLMIILISLAVLALALFLVWFFTRPVCGNEKLEKGETPETCCKDAGCYGEQTCTNNVCIEPSCSECQYVLNHTCKDYECCKSDACEESEECKNHECATLNCTTCQYLLNHTCINYTCCKDADCNDSNPNTLDRCTNPKTLSALCSNVANECNNDTDCNDNDNSTKDVCLTAIPKKCSHTNITGCINNDNYCPAGCDYIDDNDCAKINISCGTSMSCFVRAGNNLGIANVTNTTRKIISGNDTLTTSYYEIKGNESGNLTVYFKYINYTMNFTEAYKQELNDSGKSLDEIAIMEHDAQANATLRIGDYGTCKLNSTLFSKWFSDGAMTGACACTLAGTWTCTTTGEWLDAQCTGEYFCWHP
jgi:hypothetical protein